MAEKWKEKVANILSYRICPVPSCNRHYENSSSLFGHLYSHRKADIIKALYSILGLNWKINVNQLEDLEGKP